MRDPHIIEARVWAIGPIEEFYGVRFRSIVLKEDQTGDLYAFEVRDERLTDSVYITKDVLVHFRIESRKMRNGAWRTSLVVTDIFDAILDPVDEPRLGGYTMREYRTNLWGRERLTTGKMAWARDYASRYSSYVKDRRTKAQAQARREGRLPSDIKDHDFTQNTLTHKHHEQNFQRDRNGHRNHAD